MTGETSGLLRVRREQSVASGTRTIVKLRVRFVVAWTNAANSANAAFTAATGVRGIHEHRCGQIRHHDHRCDGDGMVAIAGLDKAGTSATANGGTVHRKEQRMKKSVMAAILGAVVTLGMLVIAPASASADTTPTKDPGVVIMHASCGAASPSDIDGGSWNATGGGANIRSGSSTSCAKRGEADSGHRLDYHCYTVGNDGYTWTFLRDNNTGIKGWVRDDLLSDNGSYKYCGF